MQTIRATSNNTRIKIPFCKTRFENRSCLCRCFTYMMYVKNKNPFYSSSVSAKCSSLQIPTLHCLLFLQSLLQYHRMSLCRNHLKLFPHVLLHDHLYISVRGLSW